MINQNDRKAIVVEGNIGAGKSTFLKFLKNNFNLDIIYEPTDKWQNIEGQGNLLDYFYKDTKRWAYTFQSYAFVTRVQSQIEAENFGNNSIQIFERSVYCDRYCFAKSCFETGAMTTLEWQIYKEWFAWLVENYTKKPAGFIYLQADPEVCFSRLKKRNRSEEAGVSLEYLNMLHQKHEDWLIYKKDLNKKICKIPVLVLNCNQEFESDYIVQKSFIKKVNIFLNELKNTDSIEVERSKQIGI
ncbi:AAA family ATPase [Candidatus Dependentiae bacterium]|nr:AAA family ATPase [Candidatus Dependentiae bacterium]